jgi:hypothetical protein
MAAGTGTAIAELCSPGLLSPAIAAVTTIAEKPAPTMAC